METEDNISRMEKPGVVEPAVEEPAVVEPAVVEPAVEEPAAAVEEVMAGSPELAPEGTTIVQHIPLVDPAPDGEEPGGAAPGGAEQRMATVQLGDLSGHSIHDLAEHLPNIGIHFTCKKCNISCNQMSEVLAHFTDGNCTGLLSMEGATLDTDPTKTTPAPIIIRKRGRPKKSEKTPSQPLFTVSKEAEYEELPRIAAPVSTPGTSPSGRRTRYSEGKIKRLDVLTLLGGRIKEEPVDEDDEYTPPPQALLRKRALEDDQLDTTPVAVRRPRGRPKKMKLYHDSLQEPLDMGGLSGGERMELMQNEEDAEGGMASVTIERAGNSQVIVVNKFRPQPAKEEYEQAPPGGEPDEATAKDEDNSVEATGEDSEVLGDDEGAGDGDEDSVEREDGEEDAPSDSDTAESSRVVEGSEKLRKASQPRTVYSYTNMAHKKRQNKCKICKQRFFYTLDELQLHSQCHSNQRGQRESYACVAADCTYVTNFWNRMLDHIITHPDYRERLRNAPFLKNIVGNFSCPICKKKFERKNNMKGHLSKVHFKQDRTCEICGLTLTSSDEKTYKRHVEKCQNLLFQCSHCDYKSPVSANMRKHMKIHLGQGFTCDVCNALFPTKQRYAVHRAIHEQTRQQFMCEVCGQAFMSQDAVKKHVVRFHMETNQLFACPECVFTSKIQTDLKKHITSVHNKKYQCPHCPFQTNSPTAFQQHAEYHKPGRSFACGYANCFYRGATGKQLSNHIGQVHKLGSKHECPVCHKLYKKKTHLARHLVVHTGDKPYVCLDCDMAFSSHSTYYRHRQRTGHDAKREGIVSVPQNITIQYVSQQDLALVEADGGGGAHRLVQSLHDPEAYQVVQDPGGQVPVQYVTQTLEEEEVPAEEGGEKQNIIILENENGEQVTYLLKINEEDGVATIVSEDGVQMDAGLAQQIHAQLQQLQQTDGTEHHQVEEVVIGQEQPEEGEQLEMTVEEGLEMLQGEVVEEDGEQTHIVYTTQEVQEEAQVVAEQDTEQQEVVHPQHGHQLQVHQQQVHQQQVQEEVVHQEGVQEQVQQEQVHQEVLHQEEVHQEEVHPEQVDSEQVHQELLHQEEVQQEGVSEVLGGEEEGEQPQTVLMQQQQQQDGEAGEPAGEGEQEVQQLGHSNWVHLTEDGLVTSDVIQVQEVVDAEQEIQQVIYEESVVEVDNPHGGDNNDTQYAIVLLPSSAACGDEPEAALSMLQLQSGSSMEHP